MTPSNESNDDGFFLCKYPSMSPRNRIMYLLSNGEEGLHMTLKKFCEISEEETTIDDPVQQECEEPSNKRRRKQSSHTISVTAHAVFQHLGCNAAVELNSVNRNSTLYTSFKEQLITEGTIKWRYHDDLEDVCVMSDYHSTTGLLLPPVFCSCHSFENG